MIKLVDILKEIKFNKILIPRRSPEERSKNEIISTQKKIQQYLKDGSKGNLFLRDTSVTSLPANLKVGGNLYLQKTPITSLPTNLQVEGNLYLQKTPITSLPAGLKVGGSLDLSQTPIMSLPTDLQVGLFLNLTSTPLSKKYTKEQIEQMVPGVNKGIFL